MSKTYHLELPAVDTDEINRQLSQQIAELRNGSCNIKLARAVAHSAQVIAKNIDAQLRAHAICAEIPVIKMLPKTSGIPIARGAKNLKPAST